MAREPFATSVPDERRQQFGVSAGGPIKKDKLFYFANFDQQLRTFPGFARAFNESFYYAGVHGARLRRDARLLPQSRRLLRP